MGCGAILLSLLACSSLPQKGRVLVLGFDGLEPRAVDLLISEGKLPHFAQLQREGAYSRLASSKPLLSPVVWTTIATGKTPDQHRIGHFVAVNRVTGEPLPVTSRMRKTLALWNIVSAADRSVSVVGWWATWPAETVRGSIVTDHLCYHFLFEEGPKGDVAATGRTFPPALEKELAPLVTKPEDITREEAAPYIKVSAEEFNRRFTFQDEVGHFKWALATAKTYRDIGLHLWRRDHPDLMMVYFESTDSVSHLFGHLFRSGHLVGELATQQERFGQTVEQMYIFADSILGEFMGAMDGRTTLVVLSDHGFQLGALHDDPSTTRDMRRVSERYHAMDGVLFFSGNRAKPHAALAAPSILDITPSLLSLLEIPAAQDMPGRVLSEALEVREVSRISSYETGAPGPEEVAPASGVDQEMLDQLRSLGYLQADSPAGDRNLAGVLFESGRYPEAAEAYKKLVTENPKDAALRASLAGALGAMGRYDEALEELAVATDLQPLNPEAYHNRAVIHERNGDIQDAVRDYQTALRYNPQYEPARRALRRLLEPERATEPSTAAEKTAGHLAEQASQAARRGDYQEAMRKLDEAQRLAPRYALLYQYRSNVSYLMGDSQGAIAALQKGLEIEPDNALFRENLRRLQRAPPR